jgi:hypothetical protein
MVGCMDRWMVSKKSVLSAFVECLHFDFHYLDEKEQREPNRKLGSRHNHNEADDDGWFFSFFRSDFYLGRRKNLLNLFENVEKSLYISCVQSCLGLPGGRM